MVEPAHPPLNESTVDSTFALPREVAGVLRRRLGRVEENELDSRLMWQRWSLWVVLAVLVIGMLVTLVWLAGRHEMSQVQAQLDRDTGDAVTDLRGGLVRNIQSIQAMQAGYDLGTWAPPAAQRLRDHREWLRLEWRDSQLQTIAAADSPYRAPPFDRLARASVQQEVAIACALARKTNGAAYSNTYFLPQSDGQGLEVMELCVPQIQDGRATGYIVATYSLQDILAEMISKTLTRSREVSFTEADGTRLAMHGSSRRGSRVFTAQQLLDLTGTALVLRMDGWRSAPDIFPNVLTALVTGMSIALVSVLVLLVSDMRRRMKAERDLADALAFRKAMEDSLVTGLRARDLEGRITYVNPAFCDMVGYEASELLGQAMPAPYWPPERFEEYGARQAQRLAGATAPARQGAESVFMKKNGERFPVMIFEAPLINALGVQTGWMGAILDIGEQRRVEELSRSTQERLQATARLATVGEMASMLSHELNQPLAAIASYATGSMNLLEGEAPPPADLRVAMRRIAEQAERAGKVIRSVHDFVRRRAHQRETVRPEALLDAIMPLVSLQARKLRVQIETRFEPGLPPVLCDRTMVEQVLLNLSRNAMQAMDQPGVARRVLRLSVARAADAERRWLMFSVADVGAGIAPDVASRLFTPFFTTREEGMGLGLSMCRTVIEQHGGQLAHEANRPQGTIFRFTLPVSN